MSYITHYEPLSLLNEVNKMIEQAIRPADKADTSSSPQAQWIPAVDITEDKKHFYILADLPGVDKNDISISMENNILTLKGHRPATTSEEQKNYFRTERARGHFHRQFILPEKADDSKIEASMKKGMLEIIIPKKEMAQARSIEIKSDE